MGKFFVGLFFGILIAGGLAYYLSSSQTMITNKVNNGNQMGATAPTSASNPIILAPGTKFKEVSSSPTAATESDYDFYSILQGESQDRQKDSNGDRQHDSAQNQGTIGNQSDNNTAVSSRYYVQAGAAFTDVNVANNMKAQLALQGIEADIKQQRLGTQVINLVFIGPLETPEEAQDISDKLNSKNIATQIITLKH